MKRVRWVAGSPISASDLDAEQDYLCERQTDAHEIRVHGRVDDVAPGAVGALIRAVDRSVEIGLTALAGLKPVPLLSDQSAVTGRRTWAVSIIRDILSVVWTGGASIAGRVKGMLACDGLSSGGALRLMRAVPLPDAPKPFRLLRVAADGKAKTPEIVLIELAAAADPSGAKEKPVAPEPSGAKEEPRPTGAQSGKPTIGLRVGAAGAGGFVALMEVVPGRGVVMRGGDPKIVGRRIVRKPPGGEPSDEQLAQAFLRTEAGQKERIKIEAMAKNLETDLEIVTFKKSGGQWNIRWTLKNKNQDIKLKRIEVMAALAPVDSKIAPVWTKLRPPEKSHLLKGETTMGDDTKSLPAPPTLAIGPTFEPRRLLMIVAEADYGVPVTLFKEDI
jgi:hypothetical protein